MKIFDTFQNTDLELDFDQLDHHSSDHETWERKKNMNNINIIFESDLYIWREPTCFANCGNAETFVGNEVSITKQIPINSAFIWFDADEENNQSDKKKLIKVRQEFFPQKTKC